jgi:hypothetical protein
MKVSIDLGVVHWMHHNCKYQCSTSQVPVLESLFMLFLHLKPEVVNFIPRSTLEYTIALFPHKLLQGQDRHKGV